MSNKTMTNSDVLFKLIGYTTPYGSSEVDDKRFDNLKALCEVAESIFNQLKDVASYKDRYEYSMNTMGKYADKFLKSLEHE